MNKKQNKRNTKKFRKSVKKKQSFNLPSKLRKSTTSEPSRLIHQLSDEDELFQTMNFSDHTEYIPNPHQKVPFVRVGENLPKDVIGSVTTYTNNEMIIKGGCYQNSCHLSLIDSNIKIVQGYYGRKLTKENRSMFTKFIQTHRLKKNPYGMFELWSDYGRTFVHLEKDIVIDPHSWNCSKEGIHFDITRQFDVELQSDWVYYYPIKIVDTSSIPVEMKSLLIKRVKETKIKVVLKYNREVMNIAA
jgi:hypothetical protein